MPHSTLRWSVTVSLGLAGATVGAGCTRTPDGGGVISAPTASATALAPGAASAGAPGTAGDGGNVGATTAGNAGASGPNAAAADGGTSAQFRACRADSDCVAVPRVGCCNNGWMEAVAATQTDAYAKSFTCPQPRPICPMYRIHEMRVPRCDPASQLCVMVQP